MDDNGNDLDLEYVYPPKSERICAQDERFASVNEAIGTLQYNLEQHIEKCADGLAPLADFISSSWAVIDELETRIAQLEAEQPKPVPDNYAHIPIAEWLDLKEELEALRAKWENVPWEELYAATVLGLVWAAQATDDAAGGMDACNRALEWLAANAPQEATE